MNHCRKILAAAAITGLALAPMGCATDPNSQPMTRSQKGAIAGGIGGAIIGGLIGSKKGNTAQGAIIGGALGMATGGLIGNYMDKQARELENLAEVKRVEDGIVATMKDKILFDVNQSTLKLESKTNLNKIAEVLKKYDKTEITVAGYTDNTGATSYNQQLSERRANAVKLYLANQGVAPSRMSIMGFGPDSPVASNDTPEGRAQNRRVELHISPNEQLLKEAEQQK